MLNRPDLLIVDEPIKDIDIDSRYLIIDKLNEFKNQGGTLICAYSNIELSSYLEMDQVGWLENGKLTLMTPIQSQEKWESLTSNKGSKEGTGNA